MSEPASISAGIAGRYATAVFELAREAKALTALEGDVAALAAAHESSSDFRDFITSPVWSRAEQGGSIKAIAARMALSPMLANTLGLMAANRRLFVLPQLLAALAAMIAEQKGEVTAEVTAAAPLSKAQAATLTATLSKTFARTVKLKLAVDENLIGGLVVKVGSKMIDTSIRARLASLQNAMKEVG